MGYLRAKPVQGTLDDRGHEPMSRSPRGAAARTHRRLADIVCPVDRAVTISRIARRRGTLSPDLAALRRRAVLEAVDDKGLTGAELARRLKVIPERVYQLLAVARTRT